MEVMDQNGTFPGGSAGNGQAPRSLSVYRVEPGAGAGVVPGSVSGSGPAKDSARGSGAVSAEPASGELVSTEQLSGGLVSAELLSTELTPREQLSAEQLPGVFGDGLTGVLALQGVETLDSDETGAVLSRLDQLIRWASAQQAKVLTRMGDLFQEGYLQDTGILDRGTAFTLAAEEAATILCIPTGTAQMLLGEAQILCGTHTATLDALRTGAISYGQAQIVVDQSQNIPAEQFPAFEARMLGLAAGQTRNQFRVRAQRLRESTYPETIIKRQRTAFEQRSVWFQAEPDGMSKLCALLPAEKVQLFYNQLSTAARGEQAAGDPRGVDQLRADILASLLENGGMTGCGEGGCEGCRNSDKAASPDDVQARNRDGGKIGGATKGQNSINRSSRASGRKPRSGQPGTAQPGTEGQFSNGQASGGTKGQDGTVSGSTNEGIRHNPGARTEILVLITAETLFGADDQPAELHGYGPISPETARRMARDATKWTPVERHPDSAEVLRVGRRRKVPAGIKRWLRARDGTCRFPGCRTNAVISEIDHTTPWAQGGTTDHDNLEHLCRRHHMFKTRGFWKARQCSPGIIEWTSPGGRCYRTEPHLTLAIDGTAPRERANGTAAGGAATDGTTDAIGQVGTRRGDPSDSGDTSTDDPNDYGDYPPPF